MRTVFAQLAISKFQNGIYSSLNTCSKTSPLAGRLLALPVSVVDIGLETLKAPLNAIETLALTIINLLGCMFSKSCTLKDAIVCAESALSSIVNIPIKLVMATVKIPYQCGAILLNPQTVKPFWSKS